MGITNLGAVGISAGGVYNPETVYKKYKVVSANGGSYMYINPTPAAGVPVTETSHWQQIASVGGQDLVDAAIAARDAAQGYKDDAAAYAAQLAAGTASPAGTYANLAALNSGTPAAPNTAKIYITTDDGKWCYYNGSAWVAGGVYQAANITAENVSFTDENDDYNASNVETALSEYGARLTRDTVLIRNTLLTGKSSLAYIARLINGAISTSSGNDSASIYRVRTVKFLVFDSDLPVSIADGYRIIVFTYNNGTFVSQSGWKTGTYTLPKETQIKVMIAKVTENTGTAVDAYLFGAAVTFNTMVYDANVLSLENARGKADSPISVDTGDTSLIISPVVNGTLKILTDGTSVTIVGANVAAITDALTMNTLGYQNMYISPEIPAGTYTISADIVNDNDPTADTFRAVLRYGETSVLIIYLVRNGLRSYATFTIPSAINNIRGNVALSPVAGDAGSWRNVTITKSESTEYHPYSTRTLDVTDGYLETPAASGDNTITTNGTYITAQYYKNIQNYVVDKIRQITELDKASPIFPLIHDGGHISIFRSFGVIGDSLTSGSINYVGDETDEDDTGGVIPELSWPNQLSRACGRPYKSFAYGGMSAINFVLQDHYGQRTAMLDPANKVDAYIIALGHNDHNHWDREGSGLPSIPATLADYVGTIADIDVNDYTNNGLTYYGCMGAIISMIKGIQPNARIFINTLSTNYGETEGWNPAIRQIAALFEKVYVLDIGAYWGGPEQYEKLGSHGNPIGYLHYSWIVGTYLDWYIRNNWDEFKVPVTYD